MEDATEQLERLRIVAAEDTALNALIERISIYKILLAYIYIYIYILDILDR